MDAWGSNDDVADRLRRERTRRGLSYRALAERMARAGCEIDPSALQRIEKGTAPGKPRPKIGVDELVALCRVFDLTPADMLSSTDSEVDKLAFYWRDRYRQAIRNLTTALVELVDFHRAFSKLATEEYSTEAAHFIATQTRDERPTIFADWKLGLHRILNVLLSTAELIGNEIGNQHVREDGIPVRYPELTDKIEIPVDAPADWDTYIEEIERQLDMQLELIRKERERGSVK